MTITERTNLPHLQPFRHLVDIDLSSFKMSASMVAAVCYFFLLNFPIYSTVDSPKLQDVLLALEKMVSYYKDTHRDMNLDGIYGLRVLEGMFS